MKLDINLKELLLLKEALLQKKRTLSKDESNAELRELNNRELDTIDTLIDKLDVLFKEI